MAILIAKQSGDFATAANWAVALNNTILSTQNSTGTALTTAYQYSTAFTISAGAEFDGIFVRLTKSSISSTGTVTVCLSENRSTVITATEVTLDVSNLSAAVEYMWVFFKFDSIHTATGGSGYGIGMKASATGVATGAKSSTTAATWLCGLRTTTTAAPAATDDLRIYGEVTNSGVSAWTMTYSETSPTSYEALRCGFNGSGVKLTETTGSNYVLEMNGNILIEHGGSVVFGSTTVPVASDTSFTLTFTPAVDVGWGIWMYNGSTLEMQGASKTYSNCLLNADASASATELTTDISTGWKSGDEIVIASTDQDRTHSEKIALNADASGTTLSLGTALAFAHTGTTPFKAEIINLTRNVIITTNNSARRTFIYCGNGSFLDCDWVKFDRFGNSFTSWKQGINTFGISGSWSIRYCSFTDGNSYQLYINATNAANVEFLNNVVWNISGTDSPVWVVSTASMNNVISNNIFITLGGRGLIFHGYSTCENNVVVGHGTTVGAYYFNKAITDFSWFVGNKAHSSAGHAIETTTLATMTGATLSDFHYYNIGSAIRFAGVVDGLTITGVSGYGTNLHHFYSTSSSIGLTIKDSLFGNTSFYPNGVFYSIATANTVHEVLIDNCNLADVSVGASAISTIFQNTVASLVFSTVRNCIKDTSITNAISGLSSARAISYVKFEQWNQTPNAHAYASPYGFITRDTARFVTTSPGQRIYGVNGGSGYMESGPKQIGVNTGKVATWSVKVRKSSASEGDVGTYAGTEPQLILRKCLDGGIINDTVLDTTAAGVGVWEELEGEAPEMTGPGVQEVFVRIENNSATQFITVDDWQVTVV